ncbi:MAG: hypothetical protein WCO96_04850 [Actinomycetes bacterium]
MKQYFRTVVDGRLPAASLIQIAAVGIAAPETKAEKILGELASTSFESEASNFGLEEAPAAVVGKLPLNEKLFSGIAASWPLALIVTSLVVVVNPLAVGSVRKTACAPAPAGNAKAADRAADASATLSLLEIMVAVFLSIWIYRLL